MIKIYRMFGCLKGNVITYGMVYYIVKSEICRTLGYYSFSDQCNKVKFDTVIDVGNNNVPKM